MAPQTSAGATALPGRFVRQQSKFRDRPPTVEAGRYHLYVAPACPWSHRAMIVHRLDGLEDTIDLHLIDPGGATRAWSISIPSVFERCRVAGRVATGTWKLRISGYRVPVSSTTVYWAAHVRTS